MNHNQPNLTAADNKQNQRYVEVFNLIKAYPNPYGEAIRVVGWLRSGHAPRARS